MTLRRSPSSTFSALMGKTTLVAGSSPTFDVGTLSDIDVCTILISRNTPGGTPGFLLVPTAGRGPGSTTAFVASTNAADTSSVNWIAIPKNIGLGVSSENTNNASLRRPRSGKFVRRGTTAALVAGTRTVTLEPFSASALVFVMANTRAGSPGHLSVPDATVNPTAGSFVINSSSNTDTSTVDWVLIDEYPRFAPSGPLFAQSRGFLNSGARNFTRMNPMDEEMSVIASYFSHTNPGFLGAPSASRTSGSILVNSSDASDGGFIELAAF